jgi:NAD-dependent deacetylase
VRELQKIVVLTGAGISAESGLATFRGAGGLWEGHRVEEVATPEAFARNPGLVHRFYNERRRRLLEVEPNEGHRALVQLEAEHGGEVVTVTQNIDDLHERAGSRHLMHMHGELLKSRCVACDETAECPEDLGLDSICPRCEAIGTLRPHIVWFGEMPFFLEAIEHHLQSAGLFLAVGTSGRVYPAAGFVQIAKNFGARTVEVNLEATGAGEIFDESREGPAGEVLPSLVQAILRGDA